MIDDIDDPLDELSTGIPNLYADESKEPKFTFKDENRLKLETGYRTKNSYVVTFEQVLAITGIHPSAGAILLEFLLIDGTTQDAWIPKKLCCNLDIRGCKILVWDVFVEETLEDKFTEALMYPPEPVNPKDYEESYYGKAKY